MYLNFPNYVMTEKNDNVYVHSYETYNNEGMHQTYVTGRCLFHFIDILQVFKINLVKTFIRLSCHSRLIKTVKLILLIIKCFKQKRLPSFIKLYFDLPTGPSFQYLLVVLVRLFKMAYERIIFLLFFLDCIPQGHVQSLLIDILNPENCHNSS